MSKTERRIVDEAMKLYRHSEHFPVKYFDMKGSEVTRRAFKGAYAWMDELIAACDAYTKKNRKAAQGAKP